MHILPSPSAYRALPVLLVAMAFSHLLGAWLVRKKNALAKQRNRIQYSITEIELTVLQPLIRPEVPTPIPTTPTDPL